MTKFPLRSWLVIPTLFLVALGFAQGGAAGGIGQGNIGGAEEQAYPPNNIDSGEEGRRWVSANAILTQGDKVEYKIKGVPGQTLIATVRSNVFDAALRLEDAKGKLVLENDDQYEGNQSPLLIHQFSDDKDYKLIVKNYRSTGGGAFRLYTQTFMPFEMAIGENNKPVKMWDNEPGHGGNFTYFHFKGEVGKTYAVREAFGSPGGGKQALRFRGIIGPTGVKKSDYSLYKQFDGWGPLFEVKTKGDFYLVFNDGGFNGNVSARLDVVEVTKMAKVSAQKFDLGVTGQRIFKFDVDKEDIVHSTVQAPENVSFNYFAQGEENAKSGERPSINIHDYTPMMFNDSDHIRVYEEKGEVTLIVSNGDYKPVSVTLTSAMDTPVWKEGTSITGKLALGESKFFVISAKKGDIQRINGKADGFELEFTLTSMDGDDRNFIDQRTHTPSAELQYTEDKKYLVEVSSLSGAGSGTYNLSLDQAKPEAIAIGAPIDYRDGPALGTYSIDLEANTWYQLTTKGNSQYLILDDKGDAISMQRQQFYSQVAYYFAPSRKGKVRIKVLNGAKETRFQLNVHAIPYLGG